ncbi:MAG: LysR substrate-binding domain-containing protein [Achromobacter sp.]|uniref:LysR substrate-binding domain-containing protein n=1 Tax=Achromobacter sp. TaxID=134375 RepID=UPI0029BD4E34|nr:LysR substrate-binding domain-containing protein [Achromobacter sp.]MDX3985718.1 LysR substrate-binding domain-containing protein [Achromobacter sp.]
MSVLFRAHKLYLSSEFLSKHIPSMNISAHLPTSSASVLYNRLLARGRLRHLQLVVQVAEIGSVQRAAMQLGLSQSAATKMIYELEQLVETRLFDRHARGMRPTFACKDLLPLLRTMMHSTAGCATALAAASAGIEGTVRIGAITAGVTGVLNAILPAFFSAQPHIRLELFEEAQPSLLSRYGAGELDMLLVREPLDLTADSRFEPILSDSYVVAVGPGHPLVGRHNICAQQLRDYPWACPPLDSQTYEAFEELFLSEGGGLPSQRPLTTRSLSAMVNYLATSQAILLAPLSLLCSDLKAATLLRLDCTIQKAPPRLGLVSPSSPRNRSASVLREHCLT